MAEQMAQQMAQNPDLLRQTLENPAIRVNDVNFPVFFHSFVLYHAVYVMQTVYFLSNSLP